MHRSKGRTAILLLIWLPFGGVWPEDPPMADAAESPIEAEATDVVRYDAEDIDEDQDDTADYDVDTTVDITDARKGVLVAGDLRPIVDYVDRDTRDGVSVSDERVGARVRLGANYGITDSVYLGARLAGTCFTDDCDPEFVFDSTIPTRNGLKGGQITFDELYLQWFRTERGAFALGRLQTRFVLRGGVYAKSLDRNNSNNVNVNWTDGLQGTYRARNGWNSSFVWERNARDGTGSIRHGQLDFDNSSARNTYFAGFENITRWGPVAQRGFSVSYLPKSLLKDGDANGRREDYWGFVGRLMFRWPQRSEGIRLRTGTEIGYAPETATSVAANLDTSVSGLAWNVVASIMDFRPRHNIGINYAQTGAGWLLSPQYRPNEELFEIRYQYRPKSFALLEARVRWREELEQQIGRLRKADEFDFYFRVTFEFTVKER